MNEPEAYKASLARDVSAEQLHAASELEASLEENARRSRQLTLDQWYQGYYSRSKRYPGRRVIRANSMPLRHIVLHTAAPMTWGDTSAESADLAFSILWNYFAGVGNPGMGRMEDVELEDGTHTLAPRRLHPAFQLYRTFLREVVSRWPAAQAWTYSRAELEAWLAQH